MIDRIEHSYGRVISVVILSAIILVFGMGGRAFAEEQQIDTAAEEAFAAEVTPEETVAAEEVPHVHVPGEPVKENAIDAGCSWDGSYDEIICCAVCGEEMSRITVTDAATGQHIPGGATVENVVEAGCAWDGSHDEVIRCTVCGEELSRVTVTDPATGAHQWDEGMITLAPTKNAPGIITYTCRICGATEWQEIEKLHAAIVVFTAEDGEAIDDGIRLCSVTDEEDEEADPIDPEEDGFWLLLPGMYVFTVEAGGFLPVERAPLTIEASTAENEETIIIQLAPEPEEEPEPEPVVEQGDSEITDTGEPEQEIPEEVIVDEKSLEETIIDEETTGEETTGEVIVDKKTPEEAIVDEETPEEETVDEEKPEEKNVEGETTDQEKVDEETVDGETALETETTAAPVLALELTYSGEPQNLFIAFTPGVWIRIETADGTDHHPADPSASTGEWIRAENPEDAAFHRTDAGTYRIYWEDGGEAPAASDAGQFAGQVIIEKADAIILVAPE